MSLSFSSNPFHLLSVVTEIRPTENDMISEIVTGLQTEKPVLGRPKQQTLMNAMPCVIVIHKVQQINGYTHQFDTDLKLSV